MKNGGPDHRRRGPIAWMAGNSVAANLVMLVFLVGGFLAMLTVRQEVFPDLELDIVQVSVSYPGSSPEEIEEGILLSIEEAVVDLQGVDEISSIAREGSGTVTVEALLGADLNRLAQDIQSEVDRIRTFPEGAEEPEVRVASHDRDVLEIVLYGDVGEKVLRRTAESLRDELLQDPDITRAELDGVRAPEIHVAVSQENLRRYGLTLQDIAQRVAAASADIPGGELKTGAGDILVRIEERRDYGREFAELPIITAPDGTEVLLRDIARVVDGFEDTDRYATFNGKRAAMLEVYRVGDQAPVQVSDAVSRRLADYRSSLPPGVSAAIRRDRSDIYRQRVDLLLRNMALGLVLVLAVLGIFLEIRLAFWVMMGIPISFLGSFLFLPGMDVSINMVSLFAYIISLGIVVDDAIVVGENVYHYKQEGMSFARAAVTGAREVAMPVTFSILTNIATFMPLYFVPGTMGKIFKMIPVVVITVFLISLAECLFVLPAHLSHGRTRRRGLSAWFHDKQQSFSRLFSRWVRTRYGPALGAALRHRYLTIATGVAILAAVGGFALSGRMGFGLFPKVESDYAFAEVVLPYGSPVARTERIVNRFVAAAETVIDECGRPELVEGIFAYVGRGGGHTGQARVYLADPEIRREIMSTEEFTRRWRAAVGEVAGVEYLNFLSDRGGPGGRGTPVNVELSHRDMDVLKMASEELAAELDTYPRVKDINDGFQPGKPQFDYRVLPQGKSLGLDARQVGRQVRNAYYGAEAIRQQRGRDEIKVMVRLPEEQRDSEHDLENLLVRSPGGTFVPLRGVAVRERGRAYTVINRRRGRRIVQVTADMTPRSKAGAVLAALEADFLPRLVNKYTGLTYGFEGHQAEMRESVGSLKLTFPLALMVIFAMLAIPFRSYIQPLIIMVSIPFGVIGAVIGHLVMGYDLSIISMFGIVALSGVVVNDSLVLIDFANRRRREGGLEPFAAVHDAAIQRFRPILLTTLTTFGALTPMIFETSRQARFLIPMAISLGFGLLFATMITLGLVPSLYLAVEDARRAAGKACRFLAGR